MLVRRKRISGLRLFLSRALQKIVGFTRHQHLGDTYDLFSDGSKMQASSLNTGAAEERQPQLIPMNLPDHTQNLGSTVSSTHQRGCSRPFLCFCFLWRLLPAPTHSSWTPNLPTYLLSPHFECDELLQLREHMCAEPPRLSKALLGQTVQIVQ